MMTTDNSTEIRRFSTYRIVEHQANAIAFAILVITGLSQKYHASAISQWIIITLGGVDTVRLIHHYSALLFTALLAVHCFQGAFGMMFRGWQPSMIINVKDFRDAMTNMLYYFNLSEHPAWCDRYDYRQKFEYWGVVVGGFLMVATGFILWFPVVSTRFLPGEVIPASKAAHTNEAMLAFLVIIIWHVYNSIFSPEVYPLDTAIFTGKTSRERMLHEHPVELAAIEGVSLEELLKHAHEKHTVPPA